MSWSLSYSAALRVYNKTLDYVKTFAKFDKPEAAAAIRE